MSQYNPRDDYDPGSDPDREDPDGQDARYMPRDLRVEPRGYQRGSYRPNPDARPTQRRGRRLLAPVLAATGLLLFFAIVWYAYTSGANSTTEGGMPLIKADGTPTKMRPDQPGGMEVPHQDKQIYERLRGETDTAAVERLLPPPETPVARPEPPAPSPSVTAAEPPPAIAEGPTSAPPSDLSHSGRNAPVPLTHSIPGADPEDESPVPDTERRSAAPVPPPPPRPVQQAAPPPQTAAPRPVPAPAPTQTAALPPPPAPSASSGGSFRLQIASVKTEDAARAEFQRLQRRYPDLAGLGVAYVRADLGDRGVFYRVQAGPVDEARASSICSALKAQSVGCIIVRQ